MSATKPNHEAILIEFRTKVKESFWAALQQLKIQNPTRENWENFLDAATDYASIPYLLLISNLCNDCKEVILEALMEIFLGWVEQRQQLCHQAVSKTQGRMADVIRAYMDKFAGTGG